MTLNEQGTLSLKRNSGSIGKGNEKGRGVTLLTLPWDFCSEVLWELAYVPTNSGLPSIPLQTISSVSLAVHALPTSKSSLSFSTM